MLRFRDRRPIQWRDRRPIQWPDRRIPALLSTAIFGRRHFVLCNILQMTRINQSKRDAFRPFWTGKMFTEEKDTAWEKIPDQREPKQGRVCALEKAMRNYVDRYSGQVVAPGREFDLLAEAFEFYNLYSWDIGFGIQYGQSRTNAHKSKIVQDIVCGCAGRPKKENTKSVACNCQALIRLHRN